MGATERLKRKLNSGEEKPPFSFLFLVIQHKPPMFLLCLKKNFTKKQEDLSIEHKKTSLNLWQPQLNATDYYWYNHARGESS